MIFRSSLRFIFTLALVNLGLVLTAFGQTDTIASRGLAPDPEETVFGGITRAVVIGISAYPDPNIRDLRFAHKDAAAFVDFLKSPAGGRVPDQNVRILLNEKATLAAVDDALYWLQTESEKGDLAIVYFAGHGDVEKSAHWQFGYLLTEDSPGTNFRNNALRVEDLDLLAIELSTVKEARTMFVIDACRSGTLSEGRTVPHEHLAKQAANEVRILSCKSDQVSLEGPEWGGGRGVFSYHLLRGLQGLANDPDSPADEGMITLEELQEFLRQTVVKETKRIGPEKRQDPVVSGLETFPMAVVDADQLASLQAQEQLEVLSDTALVDRSPAERGGNEIGLAATDTPIDDAVVRLFAAVKSTDILDKLDLNPLLDLPTAEVPQRFLNALEAYRNSHWIDIPQDLITQFWQQSQLDAHEPDDLTRFNQHLAIALHDKGQTLINRYLRADQSDLAQRAYYARDSSAYRHYPHLFALAHHVLPTDHPLTPRVAVKKAYFTALSLRLQSIFLEDPSTNLQQAKRMLEEGLALDDKAPYLHNELGIVSKLMGDQEQAEVCYRRALDLAPDWGLPYANLSGLLIGQDRMMEARTMAEKAYELLPEYRGSLLRMGLIEQRSGKLLTAEEHFRRLILLDPKHVSGYIALGDLLLQAGDYEEANKVLQMAAQMMADIPFVEPLDLDNDRVVDFRDRAHDDAPLFNERELLDRLRRNPEDVEAHFDLGRLYIATNRPQPAETSFKQVIRLQPDHPEVYTELGSLFAQQDRWEECESAMLIAVQQEGSTSARMEEGLSQVDKNMLLGVVHQHRGNLAAAVQQFMEVTANDPTRTNAWKHLWSAQEADGPIS